MATIFLAAITMLLVVILIVLVHHVPREEWVALLDMSLRICWAVLIATVAVSQVAITIVWQTHYREVSVFASAMPVFLFVLSFVPFAILNRDRNKWWKAIRLAVRWGLMACGLLVFAWWDPIPPSPAMKEFFKGPRGALGVALVWVWALVVVAWMAKTIWEEWPSLVALTVSKVVKEP